MECSEVEITKQREHESCTPPKTLVVRAPPTPPLAGRLNGEAGALAIRAAGAF